MNEEFIFNIKNRNTILVLLIRKYELMKTVNCVSMIDIVDIRYGSYLRYTIGKPC